MVPVFFAVGLCQCGGGASSDASTSGSSAASAGAEDPASSSVASDDSGPGLIFAQPPSSSASTDASDTGAEAEAGAEAAVADTFVCDPTLTPKEDACIINDAYAVFVAAPGALDGGLGGSDVDGNGTMGLPFATIGKALQNLNGKSRVYVCTGIYPEQVSIDEAHAASLYGGLSCAAGPSGLTWHYEGGVASVRPLAAGQAALTIAAVGTGIAVEDMGFESPGTQLQESTGDGPSTGPGQSSIGAWVTGSTVTFSRVVLVAGDAANGADGTTIVNYDPNAATAPGPLSATNSSTQTCPPGATSPPADSSGGGEGAFASDNGGDGSTYPVTIGISPRDGVGGLGDQGDYAAPGDDGADGNVRVSGVAALAFGALSDMAWLPAPGGDGGSGTPGQGGGGGGRLVIPPSMTSYHFGGAGGTGGCGGGGGRGGRGGGASVALFSVNSTVTLTASQLTSNQAGDGGAGGPGGHGQAGSAGSQVQYSGSGGMGGNGGGGAGGAGGSGGISAGIVYRGNEPVRDAATLVSLGHGMGAGAPGAGGLGGAGGSNASGAAPSASAGATGTAGAYFATYDADTP
jgi:hypothetical protein